MKQADLDVLERSLIDGARKFGAGALILVAIAVGWVSGPALGVLVLAAGTLLGAIAALWSSMRALVGETPLAPEDAFALGAPSSEEEQKRAVLRAIKDIEFERAVGKITEEDFRILLARYRGEAKRLLRQIDESRAPDRARAEELAEAHFSKLGSEAESTAMPEPASVSAGSAPGKRKQGRRQKDGLRGAKSSPTPQVAEEKLSTGKRCESCDVPNDDDASFCKGCGAKMKREGESS